MKWDKRWIVFDPEAFEIKWAINQENANAKRFRGSFKLDAESLILEGTDEHKKTHELKISSGTIASAGDTKLAEKILFLSFAEESEMLKLERRVRLAQNVRIAKMTGSASGNPLLLPKSKITIDEGYLQS
jgi:hypothetical protein